MHLLLKYKNDARLLKLYYNVQSRKLSQKDF